MSSFAYQEDTAASVECLEALQPKQWLFRAGEEKESVYRVEAGAILLSSHAPDGALINSSLVFPGDFLGLGFLSTYRSTAVAAIASTVTRYSVAEFDRLCEHRADLSEIRDTAIRSEFEKLRIETVNNASNSPLTAKVANFLSVAAHLAQIEGRNPNLSGDTLNLEQLVDLFKVESLMMLAAIHELERCNIIFCDLAFEIKIVDPDGLEAFCFASGSA